MEMGQEAAQHVSATFIKPIRLEFEKVQMLLLLPMRLVVTPCFVGILCAMPTQSTLQA
jgi:hypothetical protein